MFLKQLPLAALLFFFAVSSNSEEITTPTGIKMVKIEGGTFEMGSGSSENDANPTRQVKISSFYMDANEVTQASYTALMGINPSKFNGSQQPVERTRWTDAARYCNARSKKEGLTPCYDEKTWKCDFNATGYRLPTEAEWEYASRAGNTDKYYFKEGKSGMAKYV